MDIGKLKTETLAAIERGSVGVDVVSSLRLIDTHLLDYESELWDYKLEATPTKLGLAEFTRDVIAFYNSHGGYLIVGIADGGEIQGCEELNPQQCKHAIRNYSGIDISISIASHVVHDHCIQLVFIPKRPTTDVPLPVSKNGPDVTEAKPLFRPGDIFFRSTDNSQLIRDASDLRFLMGVRQHPSAKDDTRRISAKITVNNLPDRSAIFQKFRY